MNPLNIKALTLNYSTVTNSIQTSVEVFYPKKLLSENEVQTKDVCIAIWDTGATGSVITELTAQKLKLLPIGGTNVSGLGGTIFKNKYIVDIKLPNGVEICDLVVTELDNPTDEKGNKIDSFGMLIGMDIISRGDFSITNFEGKTTMSFREPSLHKIDYVHEWRKRMAVKDKTQRNPTQTKFQGKKKR